MKNQLYLLSILLLIMIISFPSICSSEMKTVVGEYCDVYLGDLKNKKELKEFRKEVKKKSIEDSILKLIEKPWNIYAKTECYQYVIDNYVEKVVIDSHDEKSRKICYKVKITTDTEVINKYVSMCNRQIENPSYSWNSDINNVLIKKSDKINISIIIETKIPDIGGQEREQLENEQENLFFSITQWDKDKYKYIDRRHLNKVLEEQKFSLSGLTDSETVKIGKLLNLDIIVLRLIYKDSQVTKVIKVDTGEVLLFKTYETEKEEGWIYYGTTGDFGIYYYDKGSIKKISENILKVWIKINFFKVRKEKIIKTRKDNGLPTDGLEKINYTLFLHELDCKNNTSKTIQLVEYDDKEKILNSIDIPNPTIEQVIPESIGESLIKKVCPK